MKKIEIGYRDYPARAIMYTSSLKAGFNPEPTRTKVRIEWAKPPSFFRKTYYKWVV